MIGSKPSGPRKILLAAALPLLFAGASTPAWGDDLGKRVFTTEANPPCAACHALKAADATGSIGPDLDELKPSESQVVEAVKGGIGPMPAFEDSLSAEQIAAVAKFVANATK